RNASVVYIWHDTIDAMGDKAATEDKTFEACRSAITELKDLVSLEDLADQGIDDLADIEGLTDEKAGELIMAARNICWFGDEA
ncbi:PglZ domain-containing protein, partial [Salmonella enterica subsp. enterica serovar Kentucky]|nr:PglZ domain-containing protein [Salmonella enterica subsp. enterica serovar Kentucky]